MPLRETTVEHCLLVIIGSLSMPWGWLCINGKDLVLGLEITEPSETVRVTLGRPLTTSLKSSFVLHIVALFISTLSLT